MFTLRLFLSILFNFIFAVSFTYAQTNIGGVINIYTPVIAIATSSCTNQITIQNSNGYSVGDRVLIIQMKGATIDQTNSVNFGNILSANDAGNYEFGTISAINGTTISLVNNLMNSYTISGKVQLIRVPQYSNAIVTSTLTALPWNGTVGGVLVFEVSGNLTLQADINTNGNGFRGGSRSVNFYIQGLCSSMDYFFTSNPDLGGYKGEGIAELPTNMLTGRGALANGGGGGNNVNAGGGGGGNAANGGRGGNEFSGCSNTSNGGVGGKPVLFPTKLFLGGGGGGGHQNNSEGTNGGNGGGLIIISAGTINSNNFLITSRGSDVISDAGVDGAGGGGAGGSIILNITNYIGNTNVLTNGGIGGDVNNGFACGGTGCHCHGPGGGGSGGYIGSSNISFPASVNTTITGGNFGLNINIQSNCYNTPYGATQGQNGVTQTSIVLNESNIVPVGSVIASNDTTICNGTCAQLNVTGATNYSWSPITGLSDSTIANPVACPPLTTTYIVTGTDTNNCTSTDTVTITVNPSFQLNQNAFICNGDSTFLSGNFQTTFGVYTDSLQTSLGCDSLIITTLTIGNTYNDSIAVTICQGDSIFLGGAFQSSAGIFTDSLQTTLGCDSIVTINLNVNPIPTITASNDTTIETCSSIQLNAIGGTTYLWTPAIDLSCISCANPVASPTISTNYMVIGIVNGCSAIDTVIVEVDGESELIIPNVFTPNYDGINDEFNIVGGCLFSVDKKIFNRWGELLFQSYQLEEAWDGKTSAGENVPEGTYFYVFIVSMMENYQETTKTFKGFLSLLR